MSLKSKFTNENEQHLVIRFSELKDQKRISSFYQANQHKDVDQRKQAIWDEKTKNGKIVLIEDNEENLGFVSAAYDFEHQGKMTWIELGSTINQQDPNKKPYDLIKGITLYPFILASQTIHEFLSTTPEDKIIANVYDDNKAVIYMLNERTGWDFFEPDENILKACKSTKDDADHQKTSRVWLTATTDTLPHQARLVIDLIEKGTTTGLFNKVSEKNIKLDVSKFSLANEFRAAVETLAYGPFAQFLENSPHMGMKRAHDHLAKHYPITTQLQKRMIP